MSTITAPAEIPVPREYLLEFRTEIADTLEMLGDMLIHAGSDESIDEAGEEIRRAVATHQAFREDAEAYPPHAVVFAATCAIDAASNRIRDGLPVDTAEGYVQHVRALEALREMAA